MWARLEALLIVGAYIILPSLLTVTAANGADCDGDPLACYLSSLTFTLPDFCEDVTNIEFCVTNFQCQGLTLSTLPSAYKPPTSISLGLTGLGTTCEGDYKFGLIKGTTTAVISNVDGNMELFVGKDGEFPTSANLTECAFPTIDVDISFTGIVIDLLAPVLEKFLVGLVQNTLCEELDSLVANDLTNWLVDTATPWMMGVVSSQPDEPHDFDKHYMMWGNSILAKIRNLVDRIGGLSGLLDTLQCVLADSPVSADHYAAFMLTSSAAPLPSSSSSSLFSRASPSSSLRVSSAGSAHSSAIKGSRALAMEVSPLQEFPFSLPSPFAPPSPSSSGNQGDSGSSEGTSSDSARRDSTSGRSKIFDVLGSVQLLDSGEMRLGLPLDASWVLPGVPPGCTTTFSLDAVRLRGLDSLTEVALLEPVQYNNYTLHNALSFGALTITAETTINVVPDTDEDGVRAGGVFILPNGAQIKIGSDGYTEKAEVVLADVNATFVLDAVLALNEYVMDHLFMDQLASPNCWYYLLEEISISNLQLRLNNVSDFTVSQVRGDAQELEEDVMELLDNVLAMLFDPRGFFDLTSDLINGALQGYVRQSFNEEMRDMLKSGKEQSPCLSHYPYDDAHEFIPWANSSLVYYANLLINDLVGAEGINQLLSCATNGTGSVFIETDYLVIGIGGLDSFYELELLTPPANAEINLLTYGEDGQDTVGGRTKKQEQDGGSLTVHNGAKHGKTKTFVSNRRHLSPAGVPGVDPRYLQEETGSTDYDLLTALGIGYCPTEGSPDCNPLVLSVRYNDHKDQHKGDQRRRQLKQQPGDVIKEALKQLDLSLTFNNFSLFLDTFVQVDRNVVKDTKFGQIGVSGCLASSIQSMSIEDMQFGLSGAGLILGGLGKSTDITDVVDSFLGYISSEDRLKKRNKDISKTLADSGETCSAGGISPDADSSASGGGKHNGNNDDDDDDEDFDWKWQMFILVVGCVSSLLALAYAYRYWGTAKRFLCVPVLIGHDDHHTTDEEDRARLEELRSTGRATIFTELWFRLDCKHALVFHAQVPIWLRIMFPLAVLGNAGLFLNSNIDPKAVSVMVELTIGDHTKDIGSIFDFGLKGTVWDMWDAKVYALAVLIFFFSGMWPYIKLASMLVSWVLPPRLMPVPVRETVLVVLDALGKWSLIDFYVMVLMLCAFYYNIYIGDGVEVNVTVKPKWGFYGFLLATMISLGLGHIVLACHRLIVDPKMLPIPESISPKESLSALVYQINIMDDDDEEEEEEEVEQEAQGVDGQGSTVPTITAPIDDVNGPRSSEASTDRSAGASDPTDPPTDPTDSAAASLSEQQVQERSTMGTDIAGAAAGESVGNDGTDDNASEASTEIIRKRVPLKGSQRGAASASLASELRGTAMLVRMTSFGGIMGFVLLGVTTVFTIAGTWLITMQFDFEGLVGLLLKDEDQVKYSFVDVGREIPEHSGIPDDFAVRWMQASFFAFGQAMPFALMAALAILWLVPLSLPWQKSLMVVTEVLNAWSALDVFCVAIAAALLEIEQFAQFIVGDSCDDLDKVLEEYADELLEGHDTCFNVEAKLTTNSWVIFVAAGLLLLVATPMLGMAHSAVKLRHKRMELALEMYKQNPQLHHHHRRGSRLSSVGSKQQQAAIKGLLDEQGQGYDEKGMMEDDDDGSEDFSMLIEPLLDMELGQQDECQAAASASAAAARTVSKQGQGQGQGQEESRPSEWGARSTMVQDWRNRPQTDNGAGAGADPQYTNVSAQSAGALSAHSALTEGTLAAGPHQQTGAPEEVVEREINEEALDGIWKRFPSNGPKSWWQRCTYQNFVIGCVLVAERCCLVSIIRMPIEQANNLQAERLLSLKMSASLLGRSCDWLCSWCGVAPLYHRRGSKRSHAGL